MTNTDTTRRPVLPAVSRILADSGLHIDATDAICFQARESAALLRGQGWQGTGDGYDIGVFTGDDVALMQLLGRPTTRDEQRALEACIRAELSASA